MLCGWLCAYGWLDKRDIACVGRDGSETPAGWPERWLCFFFLLLPVLARGSGGWSWAASVVYYITCVYNMYVCEDEMLTSEATSPCLSACNDSSQFPHMQFYDINPPQMSGPSYLQPESAPKRRRRLDDLFDIELWAQHSRVPSLLAVDKKSIVETAQPAILQHFNSQGTKLGLSMGNVPRRRQSVNRLLS